MEMEYQLTRIKTKLSKETGELSKETGTVEETECSSAEANAVLGKETIESVVTRSSATEE